MIKVYQSGSLGDCLIRHDNDYIAFLNGIDKEHEESPGISVVIPYFESRSTINYTLRSLINSVDKAKKVYKALRSEIIVSDDGSVLYPAIAIIDKELSDFVRVEALSKNKGRYYARNEGLKRAKNEIVLFVDSDIVVYPELISEIIVFYANQKIVERGGIFFSLFNFLDLEDFKNQDKNSNLFKTNNDFRDYCKYQASWIGCEEDKRFTGQEFRVLDETKQLSRWSTGGFLGPWMLPNMVLGGLFTVERKNAVDVGGCSAIFGPYGFEETSLVTKLMAKFGTYIVPNSKSFCLHLEDKNTSISRTAKDHLFRKTHDIYFNKYLNFKLGEAIEKDKQTFK